MRQPAATGSPLGRDSGGRSGERASMTIKMKETSLYCNSFANASEITKMIPLDRLVKY
jgi:hypothetical protein